MPLYMYTCLEAGGGRMGEGGMGREHFTAFNLPTLWITMIIWPNDLGCPRKNIFEQCHIMPGVIYLKPFKP